MSLIVDIEKNFGEFKLKVKFETNSNLAALLGASGSGKSLTLKSIAGIITPDKGRIVLNGRTLFDSEKKINVKIQDRNVGYFFQDYALFPNMNVRQNIMMGLKKYPKDYDKENELKKITKSLGLENLLEHNIDQLSGGQKQRVALARIIVNNPEIILFDEPFSALDEHLRTRLEMDMKEMLESLDKEAIIVTHNRDEAYMLSKEIILIDNGEVIEQNSTKELFKNPRYLKTAIITGCKNFASCQIKDNLVHVGEWGVTFKVNKIDKDVKYVGLRAHSFAPKEKENSFKVKVVDVIEQPFENLVRFKYEGQIDSKLIYYLAPKDGTDYLKIKKLGIKKEDILLLK